MRSSRLPLVLASTAAFLIACHKTTEPTLVGAAIHLSAAQAALLVSRVGQIAPVHPELAWLRDSVSLVLTSGAEADRIEVVTDLGQGPFYAVGLQRAISTTFNSFATFDLIAFNDPSNPTDFIIVDGYAPGAGTSPPRSVTGSFGTSTASGHLFHVAGSAVSAWRAEGGTASFSTGIAGGACLGFQARAGVSCAQSALEGSFAITVARRDDGGQPVDTRTASLASIDVAGILLSMEFH